MYVHVAFLLIQGPLEEAPEKYIWRNLPSLNIFHYKAKGILPKIFSIN